MRNLRHYSIKNDAILEPFDKALNPHGDEQVAEALIDDALELDSVNDGVMWLEELLHPIWWTIAAIDVLAMNHLKEMGYALNHPSPKHFDAYIRRFVSKARKYAEDEIRNTFPMEITSPSKKTMIFDDGISYGAIAVFDADKEYPVGYVFLTEDMYLPYLEQEKYAGQTDDPYTPVSRDHLTADVIVGNTGKRHDELTDIDVIREEGKYKFNEWLDDLRDEENEIYFGNKEDNYDDLEEDANEIYFDNE